MLKYGYYCTKVSIIVFAVGTNQQYAYYRLFKVHIDVIISISRTLNNGLALGSILVPLLFDMY